ncbi:hypothetical protein NEHOM01_2344 [Nematocida homosporus]|uniref:uncharacterized protein n=1 Tax=Nematocida homosporus TaxID=1912981 RepID=UPI00221F03BA|nr:uncharacterized protein NEHOM01_2344 [Nematocida homosporus]KAI5187753.1 hypothetical protein NEHOM01_2344 [Nematocida homosporus]
MEIDLDESIFNEGMDKYLEIKSELYGVFSTEIDNSEVQLASKIDLSILQSANASSLIEQVHSELFSLDRSYWEPEPSLRIAVHGLPQSSLVFIQHTRELLARRLEMPVIFCGERLREASHILISTSAGTRCPLDCAYVLGILLGIPVVSFDWYLDLFNYTGSLSIKTITLLNLVQGEIEPRNAVEISYLFKPTQGFFANTYLELSNDISFYAREIIEFCGGTTSSAKKPVVQVHSDEDLLALILGSSQQMSLPALFTVRSRSGRKPPLKSPLFKD